MKFSVRELKKRLTGYLRAVIPFDVAPAPLVVRKPLSGSLPFGRVPIPQPQVLPGQVDIVALLLEERQRSR